MATRFTASAPGRVNLIGDHTDYTGGLVLPMTIDRWTVIEGESCDDRVHLVSMDEDEPLTLQLPVHDPAVVAPTWGRYVAGVAAEMGVVAQAFRGHVSTTIPIGAGLSSSAALELAAALAFGFDGTAPELAALGQRAEHRASGVPCGIMDQLCIASGRVGHALLIDCSTMSVDPIPLPGDVEIVVLFVTQRRLAGSAYSDRVAECAAAERQIGPLREARLGDVATITDALIRRRAHHVVTENQRVRDFADALRAGDLSEAGRLMLASHASLRDDFETSAPAMDRAVAELVSTRGVLGARITGGGFGGCVVALTRPAASIDGWRVHAVAGASRTADLEQT